jgi:hypothetical protein
LRRLKLSKYKAKRKRRKVMEFMLQAVIIVFMLFLCALCLFAVVVIARDIVHESAASKRAREAENNSNLKDPVQVVLQPVMPAPAQAAPVAEPVAEVVAEPVAEVEDKVEELTEAKEEVVEDDDLDVAMTEDPDAVVFSRGSLTIEEKYATLSTEFKRYFDDIIRHALSKDGVKEMKNPNAYTYKIGAYKVLRLSIKRSEIVCEFYFIDKDFAEYSSASEVKMKKSATTVRVSEGSAVGVVKDGIDLVCSQIAEDKERKKELAREKRREKRRLAKEEG